MVDIVLVKVFFYLFKYDYLFTLLGFCWIFFNMLRLFYIVLFANKAKDV